MLRQGNCSFTRLYKCFTEELFSARLFLTSALYEPILSLLTEDEVFLDIDPGKVALRFPPQERARKFGAEGTPEFDRKWKEHRAVVVNKLVTLTEAVRSLSSNLIISKNPSDLLFPQQS